MGRAKLQPRLSVSNLFLALFFSLILSLSFLCSSVSEALFAKRFLSEHFVVVFGFFFVHAKAALAYSINE